MSDVVDTAKVGAGKSFDAEAFARNLARAMESSGQALAAFLKSKEGVPPDEPPSELNELIKTHRNDSDFSSDGAHHGDGLSAGRQT